MASKVLKIRLVHCPRCLLVLSEFPDIPFYTCGGCGTILQAKKRNGGRGSSTSPMPEADPVLLDESGHEDGEQVTSSNQTITCSTDTNCAYVPVESKDCGKSMSQCRSNSSQISTSGEVNCHIKDTMAETGGKPECVEGGSSNFEILESSGQLASKGMQLDAISSSDELYSHGKKVIQETEANGIELDLNQLRSSNHESSEHGDHLASMGVNNTTVAAGLSVTNIQLKVDKSYLNEKLEQPQRLAQCGSDYSRMEDEVDGTKEKECTNSNTTHGLLSKSPTTKSSHAYYGSVSSSGNDLDDHVPNHHLHLLERTSSKDQRRAGSFNNKGRSVQESDSELESQARKSLPTSSNDNYGSIITGSNHRNQDEPSGDTGHGLHTQQQSLEEPDVFHSVRSWVESEMDEPSRSLSSDVHCRRELPSVYRNDSSSSYGNEELSRSVSSNSYASGKLQRLDQDRVELLTKVEELKDQLQRMYRQKGEMKESFHSRVSQMENWRQPFSSYKPGQELLWYYNAMHPWTTPGTYGPRKAMPHQYSSSQRSSSEQSINCRSHFDHSCLHCYSQDCQYPLQFPPSFRYKKGPCQACTGHICHHPNHLYGSSISSSSKRYANSFHSSQQHKQKEKSRIKEKHQSVKRHCRPMAGGAPLVVCYKCRKLLQLPADFLLSKRRHHKLQCGACSKVLVFSLHGSNRKSPSSPIQVQHPPSDADHSTDTVTGDFASSSHTADRYLQGDPLSYSDDYGHSISKSYSTEGELASLATPFHASRLSSTNSKPMQVKKRSVSKQFGDIAGPGNLRKVFGSATPSSEATRSDKASKVTAETMKGSPLHRLMGYASASELLYGAYASPNYHARSPTFSGSVTSSPVHEYPLPRTSRNFSEMTEENDLLKRSRKNRDPSLPRSMKKGSSESNHSLENVKLKAPVNGKIAPHHQLVKRAAKKEPVQHGKYG